MGKRGEYITLRTSRQLLENASSVEVEVVVVSSWAMIIAS